MEEKIVKKRRRSVIAPPLFSSVNYEGEVKVLEGMKYQIHTGQLEASKLSDGLIMHPYSEYIPLGYIFHTDNSMSDVSSNCDSIVRNLVEVLKMKGVKQNIKVKKLQSLPALLINFIYYNGISVASSSNATKRIISNVISECKHDIPFCLAATIGSGPRGVEELINRMHNPRVFSGSFSTVSYRIKYGYHLVSLFKDNTLAPHIVCVIPKENYAWVKLNYILHGKIDLSKCIYLVDRELDMPGFWNPSFQKNFYKKWYLPYLQTLDCQVCRVPLEYIKENCFLNEWKHQSSGVENRKKETVALITDMYKYIQYKLLGNTAATPEIDTNQLTTTPIEDRTYTIHASGVGADVLNNTLVTESNSDYVIANTMLQQAIIGERQRTRREFIVGQDILG